MDNEWPDIPNTPEQRELVKVHNAEMKCLHPNLTVLEEPVVEKLHNLDKKQSE